MKLKAYRKSIIREIISSKARFFSILLIILLGVSFYSGIKATGPNMRQAVEKYYKEQNLMDSKIVSSLGLTDKDLDLLKSSDKIAYYFGSHTIDANLTNINNIVRFMEYNTEKASTINGVSILEGTLPKNSGEIALDEKALTSNPNLKVGDTFTITTDENVSKSFKKTSYKVVGIVASSMNIDKTSRGITSVGKGTIDYFALINSDDISMDTYTEAYVRFKDVLDIDAYSDEYKDKMDKNEKYLEDLFKNRSIERADEIKNLAINEINKNLPSGYTLPKEELDMQLSKLNLKDEAKYYFFDRNSNIGYSEFKDVINRINSIASVFPVFFFAVAVLICLTTMTRMVEENRVEIGTLKSLGYSNLNIAKKFIVYAASASILGSIIGILIGYNLFPNLIYTIYGKMYTLPSLKLVYYPSFIIQSIIISLLCTVGASLFVLQVELKSNPSSLMKVKAPKVGKKILIERIPFIWNKLSFNMKVTLRNIFRYKQRMIMTVLGIAGCMAMLITGFGLKNSTITSMNKQFDSLWNYQAIVTFDNEADDKYNNILKDIDGYDKSIKVHNEAVTFSKDNMNKQTAAMYIPENTNTLKDYITLRDRVSLENYTLSDNGIMINEKLAKLLKASVGDTVTFKNEKNEAFDVKIDKIYESYLSHAIYLSPNYYKKVFGKDVNYNANLLKVNNIDGREDNISTKLMDSKSVVNVTFLSTMTKTAKDSTSSLNVVILVLIVASGALAFVVLYNLNNINVSERIRELSTVKVLGFYDNEVTMYIFRENIILSILGILAGCFLGTILHKFIIGTAESDAMMMSPNIALNCYIYSALITAFFSTIVMIMMHIKLKKIDMIDALKSNE